MTAQDCACGRVVEYERQQPGARVVILVESQEDVTQAPPVDVASWLAGAAAGMVLATPVCFLLLWLWFAKPWRRGGR